MISVEHMMPTWKVTVQATIEVGATTKEKAIEEALYQAKHCAHLRATEAVVTRTAQQNLDALMAKKNPNA